jgi:hypothetical protein
MTKKQLLFVLLLITTTLTTNAQYKKASFFTRNGKFWGLKTGVNIFSQGVSAAPTIALVAGRDRQKNRIWHWWDFEYVLGGNFKYKTVDAVTTTLPINISGKVRGYGTIRYNWVVNFIGNENEDIKGKPFAKLAIEAVVTNRVVTSAVYSNGLIPQKDINYESGSFGGDIGIGYKYKLNDNFQLFGVAGYRGFIQTDEDKKLYNLVPSHPYVNVGILLAKKGQDD